MYVGWLKINYSAHVHHNEGICHAGKLFYMCLTVSAVEIWDISILGHTRLLCYFIVGFMRFVDNKKNIEYHQPYNWKELHQSVWPTDENASQPCQQHKHRAILCTAANECYLNRGICHCTTVAVIQKDTLMVMMARAPTGKGRPGKSQLLVRGRPLINLAPHTWECQDCGEDTTCAAPSCDAVIK